MTADQLKHQIIQAVALGDTCIVARQTFWDLEWPKKEKPITSQLGDLLAELRAGYCIGHGVGFEGYEFFRIKGRR